MGSRLGLVLAAMAGLCGCTTWNGLRDRLAYEPELNRFGTDLTSCVRAQCAWNARAAAFAGQSCYRDFGAGFCEGYANVASGGNGCPPPLPPRKYWRCQYENATGQRRIAAWFAGFPQGAAAAEEDGAGIFRRIPASANLQRQYQQDRPSLRLSRSALDDEGPPAPAIPPRGQPAPEQPREKPAPDGPAPDEPPPAPPQPVERTVSSEPHSAARPVAATWTPAQRKNP